MRIVVTGAAGYFGSRVTELLLQEGNHVLGIDRLARREGGLGWLPNEGHPNFCSLPDRIGSERSFHALTRFSPDAIIHLAAVVGEQACNADPVEAQRTNYEEACQLSGWARRNAVRTVFASTCSNYGVTSGIADESTEVSPVSLYSETKVAAEHEFLKAPHNVVFRFATLFGLGGYCQRPELMVNDWVAKLYKGEAVEIYGGTAWRPHLHIRDGASAISFGIKNRLCVGLYNVVGEVMTKDALAQTILQHPAIRNRGGTIKRIGLGDIRDYRVDDSKLRSLGWVPTKSISDGVDEIVRVLL